MIDDKVLTSGNKIVEDYPDLWYRVQYKIHDAHIDFEAWKIESQSDNGEGIRIDYNKSVEGFIKWDGCMEVTHKEHYCGLDYADQYLGIIKEIYKLKERAFPHG